MFQGRIKNIHFVGIGGSGMNGIAEVLLSHGFIVTGSDLADSSSVQRLRNLGAEIQIGHQPEMVKQAQVVVKSTAIPSSNPELEFARLAKIPIIPRAQMLAELMRMRYGIAVAGTHGKTTTTSMIALCLKEALLDPTIVIGGRFDAIGSSAQKGQGDLLVAEADESDGSFLLLSPTIAVITNIDPEHLEHWKSEEALINGFVTFAQKVPFFGFAVLCLDHPTVQSILPRIGRRIITYGFNSQADLVARNTRSNGINSTFEVVHNQISLGDVTLSMPGHHNICNALAAIAVGLELQIEFEVIRKALNNFDGVQRRFTVRGKCLAPNAATDSAAITLIDDYAHHPVEIIATLQAARQSFPAARIFAVFQPHRFTRVQRLFDDFCRAFNFANTVLIPPIYAAGESPIEGINNQKLADRIHHFGHRDTRPIASLDECCTVLLTELQPSDIVITLGAGNVNHICQQLVNALRPASFAHSH